MHNPKLEGLHDFTSNMLLNKTNRLNRIIKLIKTEREREIPDFEQNPVPETAFSARK
jgi:hypothetical protein